MALFGKKKAVAKPEEPAKDDDDPIAEVEEESSVELKAEALSPKGSRKGGIISAAAISILGITVIAAGGGIALGMNNASNLERALRAAATQPDQPTAAPKIPADTVVKTLDPVITNLASPSDTWVRIETAMVFKNGSLYNPEVTAAEIRQDEVAYLRTIDISQLEGPSALQHLREDLNERASLRSGGKVTELVIQTLIVQ